MHRLLALAIVSVFMGSAAYPEPASSAAESLVGVWRFDKEVDRRADGTVIATVTANQKHGFIVYTADGFVSAIIMPSHRHWALETATLDQLATWADEGTSYAGRYEINAATQTVTHMLDVSFEPAYEGRRIERNYKFAGNTLSLSGTYSSKDEVFGFTTIPLAPAV
jgi:Lipocalin-like domain